MTLSVMHIPNHTMPPTHGRHKVPNLIKAATPFKKKGKVTVRWPTRIGVLPGYTSGTCEIR